MFTPSTITETNQAKTAVTKRIELIALAQEIGFKLELVKDNYDALIKLVKDSKKQSLNLWMFRNCETVQKELLNNDRFLSIVAECKRCHHFSPDGMEKLLLSVISKNDNISSYSAEQIYETMDISKYFETHKNGLELRYTYLKYFSGRGIGASKKKRLVNSLLKLSNYIEELDGCFVKEKCADVLSSKYYSEASLVVTDTDTLNVLVDNENARKFLVFYYSKEYVYNDFAAKELKWISDNFDVLIPDLKKIYVSIGYNGITELWAIDFNCFMVMHYRSMAFLASELGMDEEAEVWDEKENILTRLINEKMWDSKNGYYGDTYRLTGKVSEVLSPASFMPLYIQIASKEQAECMRKIAEERFRNKMPTVSFDNAEYSNDYWRGPTWLNVAYFAAKGLKNYGFDTADKIKESILDMCSKEQDGIFENYDSVTGKGLCYDHFSWSCVFILEFILNW